MASLVMILASVDGAARTFADFVAIAGGAGIHAARAETPEALVEMWRQFRADPRPTLCEVVMSRDEHAHRPRGEEDARDPAGERDERGLRHELPYDLAPGCAERRADGNLALSGRASHQQQRGQVRAGDEEHEADGARQDVERVSL